jgi:hypothetical protein
MVAEVYERGRGQPRLSGDPILGHTPVGPNLVHDPSDQNWTEGLLNQRLRYRDTRLDLSMKYLSKSTWIHFVFEFYFLGPN